MFRNVFCFSICFLLVSKLFAQKGGLQTGDSQLRNLININGTLYFAAKDSSHGIELWKSNGTAAGTVMVKDIFPGSSSSAPSSFTNVNGVLFFAANNGKNGIELWKSDGTFSGTTLVKDIYPGSGSSSPAYLVNLNGQLYFSANDSIHSTELWRSDGTIGGTSLVKDINLESNDVGLYNKLVINKIDGIYGNQELGDVTIEDNSSPAVQSSGPNRPKRDKSYSQVKRASLSK